MTRSGGREASESKSGIGEDERQPVMVARRRRSNLVVLVTLRKGNHPSEAYVRRGRRKVSYRTGRGSLEGLHEEAEIQSKALRSGKNLSLSADTCLEKERVRSKVTPRKVGVGLKRTREPSKRRWARWESTEKKKASHLLGWRGRH